MGTASSKDMMTITLKWDYTDHDGKIVKEIKEAFCNLGFSHITYSDQDRKQNSVSGRISDGKWSWANRIGLESIPTSYGALGANMHSSRPLSSI
jgi:hypothetical protein